MPRVSKIKTNIEKAVVKAVIKAVEDLGDSEGSSFTDIERYLVFRGLLDNMPNITSKSIQQSLENAVEKGFLTKVADGKFKIKETGRRGKSRSTSQSRRAIIPHVRFDSKKIRGSNTRSRSVSRKRRKRSSSGKRRKRSSSGKRRKRSSSGKRRKRSSSGTRRKRSSGGKRRKRSASKPKRSRRRKKASQAVE